MKYSYNWLKELSKTTKTPEQLADAITMHSFEIESVEELGKNLEGVVTGKILDIQKHSNADKLQLTKIDIGSKTLDIVCGAHNIKEGDIIPVATIGTKLPDGEIKEAEIRGVKSFGMLCAEDELGLGKSHEGILILDPKIKIGLPLSEALELKDFVLDIKVLPDRGHDALSHIGISREICVLENRNFEHKAKSLKAKKIDEIDVEIKDEELCPRYIGAVMENIAVKESPQWLKNKLIACGLKPINNIVDATNFVMLETGQPMHAFDFDSLSKKKKIIVRTAKEGEKIILLDDTEKTLSNQDLVIADDEKVLAVAGVMGGKFSGIKNETKKIILESANFDPISIRRSKTRHNIKTDASDRYEKGLDPNLCEIAMARLVEIVESFGGKLLGAIDNYPNPIEPWKIVLDLNYADSLLGEKVPEKSAVEILENLGIETKLKKENIIAAIPTRRIDLQTQEDLIEEIGRIYGYEKINSQAPMVQIQPAVLSENRLLERKVKNVLVASGFSEAYNYAFYSLSDANLCFLGEIKHLELENPMNPDQALVRSNLLPNVLKNIRENEKYYPEFQIFEMGKVFWPNSEILPEEKNMLFAALVKDFSQKAEGFFEMKGIADSLLNQLGIEDYYYDDFESAPVDTPSLWHQGRSAEIKLEGTEKSIGYIGEINPLILNNFGIKKRVTALEIDIEQLQKISADFREFQPLRKYPTVLRDISLVSEPDVRVDAILKKIQETGGDLVLDVDLFDIFDTEDGKSSYAFHIIFGADRTLKTEEADELLKKIIQDLETEIQVKIRS
jgi:phenylalanyl-tRNA synthetase beta chain